MSYQDFKARINREHKDAVLPRVPHSDPGYIWAPSRNPLKADWLTRLSARLYDDPQETAMAIEQLRNQPEWDKEARDFYDGKLQELRREISK